MKTSALIFLLFIGIAFGYIPLKPRGIGPAKNFRGKPFPYIFGGEIVQGREFPGMVSIQEDGYQFCGGSIINEKYILTTAVCSGTEPSSLKVLSGTNYLNQSGTLHDVKLIHVHEKYNESDSLHNDIAVMEVDQPFVFDEGTSTVKLPAQGQQVKVGSRATVIGWGYTEDMTLPNDLMKVDLFLSNHDECYKIYESEGETVHYEQICADTPEHDRGPCLYDRGGPMFVDGEVVGLVSVITCNAIGYPSVYTGVSNYIDWINSKIN